MEQRHQTQARHTTFYNVHTKRALDVFISVMALVVAAPTILAVTILVRLKLGSPILFRQTRAGYKGQPFEILKFRTMTDERDENGELLPDEIRLTPFGQFLRQYSLDELPQLINVLRGDLSLVGPRPLLMQYLDKYTPEQARRHDVKPGITGLAQVNGRNAISWEEKFAWDVKYVDELSLWLDLVVMYRTAGKLIRPHGVSREGYATAPLFTGSTTLETVSDETQPDKPVYYVVEEDPLDQTIHNRDSVMSEVEEAETSQENAEAVDEMAVEAEVQYARRKSEGWTNELRLQAN